MRAESCGVPSGELARREGAPERERAAGGEVGSCCCDGSMLVRLGEAVLPAITRGQEVGPTLQRGSCELEMPKADVPTYNNNTVGLII